MTDRQTPRRPALTRRAWLLGASAGLGAIVGRQCLLPTSDPGPGYPEAQAAGPAGVLDDASQLSPTPVVSHVTIREAPQAGWVERIRAGVGGRPHSPGARRGARGTPAVGRQRRASFDGRSEPRARWHGRHARSAVA